MSPMMSLSKEVETLVSTVCLFTWPHETGADKQDLNSSLIPTIGTRGISPGLRMERGVGI
jgi:hypothetical protein